MAIPVSTAAGPPQQQFVDVYALVGSISGIRYVGKTTVGMRKRLNQHIAAARRGEKTHRSDWIRSELASGGTIEIRLLEKTTCDKWEECERSWIAYCRWFDLTNATAGGEGLHGHKFSFSHRKKIGDKHRGRKRTPEERRRISESVREAFRKNPLSDQVRQKIAAANKGKVRSAQTRKRIGDARRGKKHTASAVAKMSASHRGYRHTDGARKKMSITRKGTPKSDRHRFAMSIGSPFRREVVQFDHWGIVVGTHLSAAAAARSFGVSHPIIVERCKNGREYRGFFWRYRDQLPDQLLLFGNDCFNSVAADSTRGLKSVAISRS